MASIHIKRVSEHIYVVRQYDAVMSVAIGQMSEEKLRAHLRAQQLMNFTASEIFEWAQHRRRNYRAIAPNVLKAPGSDVRWLHHF